MPVLLQPHPVRDHHAFAQILGLTYRLLELRVP